MSGLWNSASHTYNIRERLRIAGLEDQRTQRANIGIPRMLVRNCWTLSRIRGTGQFMDKTALVSIALGRGSEILRILDRAGSKISVALWLFASEYEDWRLLLASRQFDRVHLRAAYGLVNDALSSAGLGAEKTPPILILPMSDPTVRDLRRIFSRAKSVEGMRLGGQLLGDRFIEDAYVYRIS